jgi:hypothetical protein
MNPQGIDIMAKQLNQNGELDWVEFEKIFSPTEMDRSVKTNAIIEVLAQAVVSPNRARHINSIIAKLNQTLNSTEYNHTELIKISDYMLPLITKIGQKDNFADDDQKIAITDAYSKIIEMKTKKAQL